MNWPAPEKTRKALVLLGDMLAKDKVVAVADFVSALGDDGLALLEALKRPAWVEVISPATTEPQPVVPPTAAPQPKEEPKRFTQQIPRIELTPTGRAIVDGLKK